MAIKLEICHTLPDSRQLISPTQAQNIKLALKEARLNSEWQIYSQLAAVGPPGADVEGRRHGVPLVHAWGAWGAQGVLLWHVLMH